MNINELTVGQLHELKPLILLLAGSTTSQESKPTPHEGCPFEVGKNYFIRTVTHHFTGKLVAVYPQELVITDAAWIADDGRFSAAIEKGEFNEVEPYPTESKVIVGRGSVIDAIAISFKLPRSQK